MPPAAIWPVPAPGQARHLPHEAWHVVQQAQGRVRPTLQLKAGVAVNDDAGLEHEADVMGTKGSQMTPVGPSTPLSHKRISAQSKPGAPRGPVGQDAQEALPVVQRSILKDEPLKHRFAGTTRELADQI